MLYLYGDLTEARCQEDTLKLLQRVVDMSVEVLRLQHEAEMSMKAAQREKEIMVLAVGDIDSFHDTIQKAIESGIAGRPQDETVTLMGQSVADVLAQRAKDSKGQIAARVEEHLQQAKVKNDQVATQAFGVMKGFFMSSGIESAGRTFYCNLDGEDYLARSEIIDAAGICCSYSLDTAGSEFFSSVKRFGDLAPGKQEIPIDTKKGWLKKDPVPVTLRIDDAQLTQVTDTTNDLEFRLAPRPGSGISEIVVRSAKALPGSMEVYKVDESKQTVMIPTDLFTGEHADALTHFSEGILRFVHSLYSQRKGLLGITIDGKDVAQERLFIDVVRRLIAYLAPIVREIEAHSGNPEELSLKIEHEEGRREEFFLRKKNLVQRIAQLPGLLQALFEPLNLGKPPIRDVSEPVEEVDKTIEMIGIGHRVQRKTKKSEPEPPTPPPPTPEKKK
ncbi:hypothetical protein ACFL2F_01420 [Myxococcota bacterium]